MIGEGSFSCVFLARDATTQKGTPHQEYAIKVRGNDKVGEQEDESLSASIVPMQAFFVRFEGNSILPKSPKLDFPP